MRITIHKNIDFFMEKGEKTNLTARYELTEPKSSLLRR
jgi:hypothetical protein